MTDIKKVIPEQIVESCWDCPSDKTCSVGHRSIIPKDCPLKDWEPQGDTMPIKERIGIKTTPISSDRELLNNLKYIIESPAYEYGGFHPQVVETAKAALKEITTHRSCLSKHDEEIREQLEKQIQFNNKGNLAITTVLELTKNWWLDFWKQREGK
jgi:hypothetical protein